MSLLLKDPDKDRDSIIEAYRRGGSWTAAAKQLGISERALLEQRKRHGINKKVLYLCNKLSDTEDGSMSPIQLATLFHYRYIRIHLFEDGNGRIARLMVNFILHRHKWPMMVIRSKNKKAYLNALALADTSIGPPPADWAHASLQSIAPFVD